MSARPADPASLRVDSTGAGPARPRPANAEAGGGPASRHGEPSSARPSLLRDEEATSYAEFLIAGPPVMLLFLALMQLGLAYAGKLVVRHAANRAARAAVVVLPDDPRFYEGEPINEVDYDGAGRGPASSGGLGDIGAVPPGGSGGGGSGSGRLQAIRAAAYAPLLSASPDVQTILDWDSVGDAFQRGATPAGVAPGALAYGRGAVAISFPQTPGEDDYRTTFAPREPVTTRVTYLFYCAVPIVSRFMCDEYSVLFDGRLSPAHEHEDSRFGGGGARPGDTFARDGLREGVSELQSFAEMPLALRVFSGGPYRFMVFRAEATLPNQGAGYVYAE